MKADLKDFKIEFKARLYKLAINSISFIDQLSPDDMVVKRLGDQLLRSATSVIGNYIEAESATSTKELIKYLNISLRSSNESILWLNLLNDTKRTLGDNHLLLIDEFLQVSKILAKSILTLKQKLKTKSI